MSRCHPWLFTAPSGGLSRRLCEDPIDGAAATGCSGRERNWWACFLNKSSQDMVCGGGLVGNIAMRSCPEIREGRDDAGGMAFRTLLS